MSTKFDQFVGEVLNPKLQKDLGSISSETEVIRSIRQDLTKCGSRLENLKYQLSDHNDHKKAAMAMDALISIDNARKILFKLQD